MALTFNPAQLAVLQPAPAPPAYAIAAYRAARHTHQNPRPVRTI